MAPPFSPNYDPRLRPRGQHRQEPGRRGRRLSWVSSDWFRPEKCACAYSWGLAALARVDSCLACLGAPPLLLRRSLLPPTSPGPSHELHHVAAIVDVRQQEYAAFVNPTDANGPQLATTLYLAVCPVLRARITLKSLWVAKLNSIGALQIVTEPFQVGISASDQLSAFQMNCIECFR